MIIVLVSVAISLFSAKGEMNCTVVSRNQNIDELRAAYIKWRIVTLTKCGKQLVKALPIIHGKDAPESSWPWQAAVYVPSKRKLCGGVLIDAQWILTAAHCVYKSHKMTVILALTREKHEVHQVSKKIQYPNYNSSITMNRYDIALLKINPPAKRSLYTMPACLPPPRTRSSYWMGPCYLSGLGSTVSGPDSDKSFVLGKLQQLQVKVMPTILCNIYFLGFYVDVEKQVCLDFHNTKPTAGACHGDSGGPLSCLHDGNYYVMGIVQFGEKSCLRQSTPDVLARVSYFHYWIIETMKENS